MYVWMDGYDGCCMDGWMDVDGCMDGWMDGCRWMYVWMDGWM